MREEKKIKTNNEIRDERKSKRKGKREVAWMGWTKRGERTRWLTNQFRSSLHTARITTPHYMGWFNESGQTAFNKRLRLAVTAAMHNEASQRGKRGILIGKWNDHRFRSVETTFISILPENPSFRLPPLSAHRSHGQSCEEDDAHLEAMISSVERRRVSASRERSYRASGPLSSWRRV